MKRSRINQKNKLRHRHSLKFGNDIECNCDNLDQDPITFDEFEINDFKKGNVVMLDKKCYKVDVLAHSLPINPFVPHNRRPYTLNNLRNEPRCILPQKLLDPRVYGHQIMKRRLSGLPEYLLKPYTGFSGNRRRTSKFSRHKSSRHKNRKSRKSRKSYKSRKSRKSYKSRKSRKINKYGGIGDLPDVLQYKIGQEVPGLGLTASSIISRQYKGCPNDPNEKTIEYTIPNKYRCPFGTKLEKHPKTNNYCCKNKIARVFNLHLGEEYEANTNYIIKNYPNEFALMKYGDLVENLDALDENDNSIFIVDGNRNDKRIINLNFYDDYPKSLIPEQFHTIALKWPYYWLSCDENTRPINSETGEPQKSNLNKFINTGWNSTKVPISLRSLSNRPLTTKDDIKISRLPYYENKLAGVYWNSLKGVIVYCAECNRKQEFIDIFNLLYINDNDIVYGITSDYFEEIMTYYENNDIERDFYIDIKEDPYDVIIFI